MSNSYVQGRVREAVMAAKGSRSVAQQLLTTWATEDHKLLIGMAQPFLKAIIAAAMEGELRRVNLAAGRAARAGNPNASRRGGAPVAADEPRLSKAALTQVLSRLGDAPPVEAPAVNSRAGDNRSAGTLAGGMQSTTISVSSKGDAAAKAGNVTHEKAMMAIAKAFAVKKF